MKLLYLIVILLFSSCSRPIAEKLVSHTCSTIRSVDSNKRVVIGKPEKKTNPKNYYSKSPRIIKTRINGELPRYNY